MEETKRKTSEFDVIAVVLNSLREWKLLFFWLLLSGALGVVVALHRPKYYTAEVVLAPEMSSGGLGMSESLSSMASTFGIDLGSKSSMDAIYPELYPTVFASTDFILDLFPVNVHLKLTNEDKTYLKHLQDDYKVPFWEVPINWVKAKLAPPDPGAGKKTIDPFRLTRRQEILVDNVRNSIACLIDQKTSVITIGMTDIDPEVAAVLCDTLQVRLQAYITDYRTKKARQDYEYYQNLADSSLVEYHKARDKYAEYSDTHQGATLEAFTTIGEELENKMQMCYNVYTTMSQQAQTAKAKIQERIPAYTIIQRPTVPNKPSSMPKIYTLIFFLVGGGMIQLIWVNWGRRGWKSLWRKSPKQN